MKEIELLTKESIILLKNNRLLEAENLLDTIIKKYPGDSTAFVNKIFLLIQKNEFTQAKKISIEATRKFPNNSQMHNGLGIVYLKQQQTEAAEENFIKSIQIDYKNYDAYINLSNLYISLQKFDEALNFINIGIVNNPNHIALNEIRYFLLKQIGDSKKYETQGMILKKIKTRHNLYLDNHKKILNKLNEINLKLADKDKNCDLIGQKIELLLKLKLYSDALNNINYLLQLNGNEVKYYELKIFILIRLNKFEEALDIIKLSENKFFKNSNIIFYKAILYKFMKKYDYFISCMKRIDPDALSYENQYEYAKFLLGQDDFINAWKFFDARHKLDTYSQLRPKIFKNKNVKKIALLPELGLGDQILFLTCLKGFIRNSQIYDVYIDEKLIDIFKEYSIYKNNKNINFFSESHYPADTYDEVLFLGDILKFTIKNDSDFINHPIKLIDIKHLNKYRKNKLKRVGISWKSKNIKLNKELSLNKIIKILNSKELELVNLQYGNIDELKKLSLKTNLSISTYDNLDKFNDIEELLFLIESCDVVLTSSNITAHLSGILNKPTILILPSRMDALWYWQADKNKSKWYPSIKVVELDKNYKIIERELENLNVF